MTTLYVRDEARFHPIQTFVRPATTEDIITDDMLERAACAIYDEEWGAGAAQEAGNVGDAWREAARRVLIAAFATKDST